MNFWICKNCGKKVVSLLKTCPKCKTLRSPSDILQAPERSERTADGKMKPTTIVAWVLFSVLAIFAGLACYVSYTGGFAPKPSRPSEPSPSSFSKDTHLDISRALVVNNVSGCGMVRWALNPEKSDEYTVKCSMDGENWDVYLVWPLRASRNAISGETVFGKVEGPVKHEITNEPVKGQSGYLSEAEKALPKVERVPLPFAAVTTIPVIDKTKLK